MNPYYTSVVPPGHGKVAPHIKVNEHFQFFDFAEKSFSPEECRAIVDLGKKGARYPYFSQYSSDREAGSIDRHHEHHEANELAHGEETDWVYRKVWELAMRANAETFRFHVRELSTSLVLRTYRPGSDVKWHFDNVKGGEKIGVVLQLSQSTDYQGGDLVLAIGVGDGFLVAPRAQGTLILFPTFVCHSVLAVTSGVRHTLVGWLLGDTFV